MNRFDFVSWLADERKAKGLSFRALAAKTALSAGHLNNLEKGTSSPTDEVLMAVAVALDVNPDWLIAQVDTTRIDPERIARLRRYAPEFLGLELRLASESPGNHGDRPPD